MAPLIALAVNLIPLVADVAPSVVRFLVGDKAADSTQKVTKAASLVAKTVKQVTGFDVTTEKGVEEVRKQLQENPNLQKELKIELLRVDLELERIELDRDKAYLADTQDARAISIERLKAGSSDMRANLMLTLAFVAVIAIIVLLITMDTSGNEAVMGFVLGIGGMFARNIGSAFDFEFGSSKGSKDKDAKMQLQSAELQLSTHERIADKQEEVEDIANLVKKQIEAAQTAGKIVQAISTASKLRGIIKES